jgi:hypothetical protein
MKVGDLGILLVSTDSARVGDHCLILEEPVLAKVGAWGAQEEVRILCLGKEIRLPVYFVKVVESHADSQA